MPRQKSVHDAPFLQIIGSHFDFHLVAGEDANAMHAHATRQVAQEFVIFRLVARHTNAEGGIGKSFFHNADEFDNVFGHGESFAERAVALYRANFASASLSSANNLRGIKIV